MCRIGGFLQLEDEVQMFTTLIQRCVFRSTYYTCLSKASVKYPSEILILVKEMRNARKKWTHFRAPKDKTIVNNFSQKLKRKIKKLLFQHILAKSVTGQELRALPLESYKKSQEICFIKPTHS